ncbi:MAG TPA: hypothetical protein VJH24_01685 [Candidatus Bilamarchaeaceae archaeon]|nr:hypothetical protein [Candidatus Bilamarchaeaceae archaeon]
MVKEIYLVGIGLLAFLTSYIFTHLLIPRLQRFRITGQDMNKPTKTEVAEMGGLAVVAGISAGVMLAVFLQSFFGFEFNLIYVLAAVIAVHTVAFIGIVDDLLGIPQWLKALLPLIAAVPLVAVSAAGSTTMNLPLLGIVDLGSFYILVLIPIGIAVSSNLTNMLAGFNGMEAGMGSIIFLAMTALAFAYGVPEMLVLFIPMLGALLGFLPYNTYPAKIFPGDVGNLTIGATLAAGVIIGNAEGAGALLLIPYAIDFFIKLANKFPSKNWWGVYKDGKLYAPSDRIRGLAQLVMKLRNGVTEKQLTSIFILIEIAVAVIVLLIYLPR